MSPSARPKWRDVFFGKIRDFAGAVATRQVHRNALFSVAQVVVSTLCLFLAYRILIDHAGVARLGLWSLLIATSAMIRMADASGGSGLARFVAIERTRQGADRTVQFIHTVLLTTLIFNGVVACILYAFSDLVIERFVEPAYRAEAASLMPFAICNIVLIALSTAIFSSIDGTHRADRRAVIGMLASVLLLMMTVVFVPSYGIEAFAWALVVQQAFMIVAGWMLLRRRVGGVGWLPWRFDAGVFRETFAFGARMQVATVAVLLFEPLAKLILSHWGGLASLGVYEIASRLVAQVRALIVAAVEPTIAAFAAIEPSDRQRLKVLIVKATWGAAYASVLLALATIIVAPIASVLLLGDLNAMFLLVVFALMLGWNINALVLPIYFAALGRGILKWNVLSSVLNAVLMIAFGTLLGRAFGAYGVVACVVMALLFSTSMVLVGNVKALDISDAWRDLSVPVFLGFTLLALLSILGVAAIAAYVW